MDFIEATDQLTECLTHQDIADALGMASVQSVRQARLDPSAHNYRPPPEGWRTGIARLARSRIQQLDRVAEELEMHAREAVRSRPPPGAPPPPPTLVAYLEEALEILHDVESTENVKEFRRAREALDRLLKGVRNFDRNAFPSGFSNRVLEARWELNAGEARSARQLLESLLRDWEEYWS